MADETNNPLDWRAERLADPNEYAAYLSKHRHIGVEAARDFVARTRNDPQQLEGKPKKVQD
jgi:hypothetical protein